MTKRQKIAESFTTALSNISIANNYRVDFPTAKHWSTEIEPQEDQKVVVVRDRSNNSSEDAESEKEILIIDVLLACRIKDQNYATICNMIDDIKKWFYNNRKSLEVSLNCPEIKYISDEVALDRAEFEIGAGRVVFNITTGQNSNWTYDDTVY